MSRISYVNGIYANHAESVVSIDDRGLQFSDGVYEVIAIWKGAAVDLSLHLKRLARSMDKLDFSIQPTPLALPIILRQVLRKNRVKSGIVYLQVNRGSAPRNHSFSDLRMVPTCIVTAKNGVGPNQEDVENGIRLRIQADERWKNRDIKSISLLPNVLSKQNAVKNGFFDSLFLDSDGSVNETSTANIWYINDKGALITRSLGQEILGGVTRLRVALIAKKMGYQVQESIFNIEELLNAKEVFITSTTVFLLPVSKVGDHKINNGNPGPIYKNLLNQYYSYLNHLNIRDSWNALRK
jgi:D-alanine transaminase